MTDAHATPWCYREDDGTFVSHRGDPCAGWACAKARLKDQLAAGDLPGVDAAWVDYEDSLAELVAGDEDRTYGRTIEADPEYDDLANQVNDALALHHGRYR